jgi:hypothetical protein
LSSIRDRAASTTRNSETFHVDEWGVDVEVRAVSVAERDALVEGDPATFGPRLVIASVYDPETGEKAFTDSDVDMLCGLPAGLGDALVSAAFRVSRLGTNAVELGKGGS